MDDLQKFIDEARRFFHVRRTKWQKRGRCAHAATFHKRWEKLGSGHYGEAWAHPDFPHLVLKISGPSYWGSAKVAGPVEDAFVYPDGWPVFARHCLTYKHPHLPNIMHMEEHSAGLCWAVMPKYTLPYKSEECFPCDLQLVRSFIAGLGNDDGPEWAWPIRRMVTGLNLTCDLHSGNVMWCSVNETWVLTDPLSEA